MADDAAGAVRRTPRPARDDLINQAAQCIIDTYAQYAPVPGVLHSEAGNIVRALADASLLADPERQRPVALLRRLAELAEASGKLRTAEWLRACALLPPNEWNPAPAYKGPMVPAAELEEARAAGGKLIDVAEKFRAERDALQDRLDEIRTVLAEDAETRARFQVDTSTSYGPRFLSRIREIVERESGALQGDQSAEPWTPSVGERVTGVETQNVGQPVVTGYFHSCGADGLSWLKVHADDPETAQRYLVGTATLRPAPAEPPPEEDVRSLRLHLASVHKLANAFAVPAADLDDIHQHDHFGPCGLRNHDIADRSYDEAEACAVAAEVEDQPTGEVDRG